MGCFLNCKSEAYKKVFQIPNFVIQKLFPEKMIFSIIFPTITQLTNSSNCSTCLEIFFCSMSRFFLLYGHCCIVVSKVKVDLVIDFSFNDQRCFYYWPRRDYKSWSKFWMLGAQQHWAVQAGHHPVIKLKKKLRAWGAKISSEMADYK